MSGVKKKVFFSAFSTYTVQSSSWKFILVACFYILWNLLHILSTYSYFFPKIHFYFISSSLSPCFFTLLSYTYSQSNLILYVYTPPLQYMTSLHMLRDIAFLFICFICLFVHPFMRHLLWIIEHTTLSSFSLSSFLVSSFLCHSLPPLSMFRNIYALLCECTTLCFYSDIKLWKFNCFCVTKSNASLLLCSRQTFVCVSSSFYVFHPFLLNYYLMSYHMLCSLISTLYVIFLNLKFFFIPASTGHIIISLPAWPPAILCCM